MAMMGASGGGWTSLLAAAIDTRIAYSASVAGSLPMYLRTGACGKPGVGDAEQRNWPGNLYSRITYVDLYIMAANGARKKQQGHHQNTCKSTISSTLAASSESPISRVEALTRYIAERRLGVFLSVKQHVRGPRVRLQQGNAHESDPHRGSASAIGTPKG